MKNCFGMHARAFYGWPKNVLHSRASTTGSSTSRDVRPPLAIVDGIIGMEGDGPIMGDPVQSGVIVVSKDGVAADVTASRLMGMDPEKIGYLMEAGRFLGQARSELIEQRGEDPERLATQFRPAPHFEHLVA